MKITDIQDESDIERYAIENDMSKQDVRELWLEIMEETSHK